MPTYDYVCTACGHVVEVMHGVHDHGPTICPNCHAHAMRKAINAPTILYKGTGWAKKDRGSNAITKAAAKAGSSESGSESAAATSGGAATSGSSSSSSSEGSSSSGSESGSSSGTPSDSGSTGSSGSSGSSGSAGSTSTSAAERD